MEHLNYCRQMVKQFTRMIEMPHGIPEENLKMLSHGVDLANASHKFILPEGGRLYDDPNYRALDESVPLRLPYPFVALEYSRRSTSPNSAGFSSSKAIVFAREREGYIVITPVMWIDHASIWGPGPDAAIPTVGYLDRATVINGYTAIKIKLSDERFNISDYACEVGALLCFLNVLNCKNVHIERSEPRKAGKKIKAALPFDTYHVLTIDVGKSPGAGSGLIGISHRSPREHLRRGHIRRLEDGRRIWVNATVVAAGRGAAKVEKDYRVTNSKVATGGARMAA